jgi:class 3 adenylate cyclase
VQLVLNSCYSIKCLEVYIVNVAPLYLASELEKMGNVYGSPILMCSTTRDLVKDQFHIRQLDVCTIRGSEELHTIYEIMGTAQQDLKHDVMTVLVN